MDSSLASGAEGYRFESCRYDRALAAEITGLPGNQAILRVGEGETAKWAADKLLKYEYWKESRGQMATSTKEMTHNWLPDELQNLPRAGEENGIHGCYRTPDTRPFKAKISWKAVRKTPSSCTPFAC